MQSPQSPKSPYCGSGCCDFSPPPPPPAQICRRYSSSGLCPPGSPPSLHDPNTYSNLEVIAVSKQHYQHPEYPHQGLHPYYRGGALHFSPLSAQSDGSWESYKLYKPEELHRQQTATAGGTFIHNYLAPGSIEHSEKEVVSTGEQKKEKRICGLQLRAVVIILVILAMAIAGSIAGALVASRSRVGTGTEAQTGGPGGSSFPSPSGTVSLTFPDADPTTSNVSSTTTSSTTFTSAVSASSTGSISSSTTSSNTADPSSSTSSTTTDLSTSSTQTSPSQTISVASCPDDNLLCQFTPSKWYHIQLLDLDIFQRIICSPPDDVVGQPGPGSSGIGYCKGGSGLGNTHHDYWHFRPVDHGKMKSFVASPEDLTRNLRTYQLHNRHLGPGYAMSLERKKTVSDAQDTAAPILSLEMYETDKDDTRQYWYLVNKQAGTIENGGEYWVMRNVESGQRSMFTGQKDWGRPLVAKRVQDDDGSGGLNPEAKDEWKNGSRRLTIVQAVDADIDVGERMNNLSWEIN